MTYQVINLTLESGQVVDLTLDSGQVIDLSIEVPETIVLSVESGEVLDLSLETGQIIDLVVDIASAQGARGLPGEDGALGSSDFIHISRIAHTVLSGHRIVTPLSDGSVVYADHKQSHHINRPLWLTTSAWSSGAMADLVTYGQVEESSWHWIPNKALYLGSNGHITQILPDSQDSLFMVQVGMAETSTRIFFDPVEPLLWNELSGDGYSDTYSDVYGVSNDETLDELSGYSNTYSDTYSDSDLLQYSDKYADAYSRTDSEHDTNVYTNIYSDSY